MFVILWEFRVAEPNRAAFERAYGAEGIWAEFFRRGEGYVRTELLRDLDQPDRYVTMDFWASRSHFERFSSANAVEYKRIDAELEALTLAERRIAIVQDSSLSD